MNASSTGPTAPGAAAAPLQLPPEQWQALRLAYAEPPRAYHNFGHIEEVLRRYAEVSAGPGWHRPAEVWLAVLYHDAVYVPGRGDNEAASARLAEEHIMRWLPQAGVSSSNVRELILLTARHGGLTEGDFAEADPVDAADSRHFLDCDLATLGAEPEVFAAYDRAIAEEYRGRVPGWLYRINRRRFFKRMLASERIFLSDFFRERYEARARQNLRAELGGG